MPAIYHSQSDYLCDDIIHMYIIYSFYICVHIHIHAYISVHKYTLGIFDGPNIVPA